MRILTGVYCFLADGYPKIESEVGTKDYKFQFKSYNYLRCYIQHVSFTISHATSTSRIELEEDQNLVVDSHLRVKRVDKLRQIDAGIMPSIRANRTDATIKITERGVDFIRKDWNVDCCKLK